MKPRFAALLASCALLWLAVTPAVGAQDGEPTDIQILDVITDDHPTITMSIAVPPELGDGPLRGTDFALTEGGTPQPVAVTAETSGIDVILAIDTSGSMRPNNALGQAKAAALTLIDGLPGDARVGVIGFGSTVNVAGELTTDRDQTRAAINSLDFSGDTALWDALFESADALASSNASRYTVVLTDGTDDGSAVTEDDALNALQEADVALYAVGLETNDTNFGELRLATRAVGGAFEAAESVEALEELYRGIGERLTSRYNLEFLVTHTGPTEIAVSVATTGGLATARQTIDLGGTPDAARPVATSVDLPPVLNSTVGAPVTGLGQNWALWLGASACFIAIAILGYNALRPAARVRLAAAGSAGSEKAQNLPGFMTDAANRAVAGTERGARLDKALDAAGMEVRPGELVLLVSVVAIGLGLVLSMVVGPWAGIGAGLLVVLITQIIVSRRLRRRREAFANQLGDTLTIMAGALRAGRGLPQALDLVAEETASPTKDEFRRVIIESRVGRDLTQSLNDVADRMQNEDFGWLAEAVALNRELGGDLAEILDNVASVVRDRNQVRMQIKAMSAEGRMSGVVLVAIPVVIFFYIQIANPSYGSELLHGGGLIALGVGILAIIGGWFWIRNLSKLDY